MSTFTIPKTMRGILITKTGGPEVLEYHTDLPVPVPKAGEVLVKNSFAGINYIDTYFRRGIYPSPKPEILGREASGLLVSLGPTPLPASYAATPISNLALGDRVVFMSGSAYAEYSAVPAKAVLKLPEGISDEVGVGAFLQGLTALTMIREGYAAKKGEFYLVHAAAGGVGLWLCQLLSAIGGRVIGTASTPEKRALAASNGAEFTISSTGDWASEVSSITKGDGSDGAEGESGCHAIFDGVGKVTFDDDLKVLRRKGTLVSFGNASGVVDPCPLAKLTPKNARLLRPTVANYLTLHSELTSYATELFQFILDGKAKVEISKVYDLEGVKEAHEDLEGRRTVGKLLLRI